MQPSSRRQEQVRSTYRYRYPRTSGLLPHSPLGTALCPGPCVSVCRALTGATDFVARDWKEWPISTITTDSSSRRVPGSPFQIFDMSAFDVQDYRGIFQKAVGPIVKAGTQPHVLVYIHNVASRVRIHEFTPSLAHLACGMWTLIVTAALLSSASAFFSQIVWDSVATLFEHAQGLTPPMKCLFVLSNISLIDGVRAKELTAQTQRFLERFPTSKFIAANLAPRTFKTRSRASCSSPPSSENSPETLRTPLWPARWRA
jgi:hypothetical protein